MSRKQQEIDVQDENGNSEAVAATLDDDSPYADAVSSAVVSIAAASGSRVVEALKELATAEAADSEGEPLFRSDTMLESLRYENYDFVHGIGELVDNSVEGGAHNIWVAHKREELTVRKVTGKKGGTATYDVVSEVAVVDDGEGMSADVLGKALVLGESCRPRRNGALGIGRFGVGMTLGALSLARRVDVFSRDDKTKPFLHTWIDLDKIKTREQKKILRPVPAAAPAEYAELLKNSTGTIVVLSNCDRLQLSQTNQDKPISADAHVAGLANWLGRTYRKFVAAGLNVWLDGTKVYLHDPLYLLGPTMWDAKGKNDPKAKDLGTRYIELPVPGQPDKTAKVAIRMTFLPVEFRERRGQGGKGIAAERRVDENEGVSILRADREVLYDKVPYLYSKVYERGGEIDRFWGCEISFPPELDPYFHVKYIKRGAEPVSFLRAEIRKIIDPTINDLRTQIKADFKKSEEEAAAEQSAFTAAEDALAAADRLLPRTLQGSSITREEEEQQIEESAEQSVDVVDASPEEKPIRKAAEKKRLSERQYSIVAVRYPADVFFTTKHLHRKIIIELNTNHPFYHEVFEPLCGTAAGMTEESDVHSGAVTPEQRLARDAFMMLLLAYARAEAMFGEDLLDGATPRQVFATLRTQWGLALGTAISKADETTA